MKLFDLHCDTPYRLFKDKKHLQNNDLHVSLEKAEIFERYIQCAAVWSDSDLCDCDCLDFFYKASKNFEKEAGGFIKAKKELEELEKLEKWKGEENYVHHEKLCAGTKFGRSL